MVPQGSARPFPSKLGRGGKSRLGLDDSAKDIAVLQAESRAEESLNPSPVCLLHEIQLAVWQGCSIEKEFHPAQVQEFVHPQCVLFGANWLVLWGEA